MFSVLCFQTGRLPGIIGALITLAFVMAVVTALFYMLWGASKWINSGGDKLAVEGARGQIIAAGVALIILFLTFLILSIVFNFFGIDIGGINIPRLQNT